MLRYKIAVYVPVNHADAVRNAIGVAGGGQLGNYAFCSFSSKGIGRFFPQDGARPAIGEVGKLEQVEEERIEVTCTEEVIHAVVAAIRRVHPYEEIAMDILELKNI